MLRSVAYQLVFLLHGILEFRQNFEPFDQNVGHPALGITKTLAKSQPAAVA